MADKDYRIGRFLFDTLTSGMYDNPLCVYREYVQNSADSIDECVRNSGRPRSEYEITITIDPSKSRVCVRDNGGGIAAARARKVLLSVGDSDKFGVRQRGFRGIGRLGGVAYCDRLTFTTKAVGDADETVCTWDCKQVRQLLMPKNQNARGLELTDLIDECVKLDMRPSKTGKSSGYFLVEMEAVKCSKNSLLDLSAVRSYLSQIAPVPFDTLRFSYGKELDGYLTTQVPNYSTYRLILNGDEVFKPYSETVAVRKNGTDKILRVEHFELKDREGRRIAVGWQGVRKANLAQLSPATGEDGFRVRVGNIMLGGASLLDQYFPEPRFNGYHLGEIHITDPDLTPNARRDDFEDSELKTDFYNAVSKQLGGPLTKVIRDVSKKNSDVKPLVEAKERVADIQKQVGKGFHGLSHRDEVLTDLRKTGDELARFLNKRSIPPEQMKQAQDIQRKVKALTADVRDAESRLDQILASKYSKPERHLIMKVLDCVFTLYETSPSKEKLIEAVTNQLST